MNDRTLPPADADDRARARRWLAGAGLAGAAGLALVAPSLLAHNVAPSATFWNQALALCGGAAWVLGTAARGGGGAARACAPVLAALATLALVTTAALAGARLPRSFAVADLGLLAAAALLLWAGAQAGRRAGARAGGSPPGAAYTFFTGALLAAGVLGAGLAAAQVLLPDLADGTWLARPAEPGRAGGNLRQPNHLATLLLWAVVALATLHALRRLPTLLAAGLLAALVAAVVMTASRTGLLSVLLLALWGAVDTRLPRPTRALLLAAPLAYGLAWGALTLWAEAAATPLAAARRLAGGGGGDLSSSRLAIWADTLTLLQAQPWTGVGWGRFNLAWSLTPLPGRPTAFFDHTHNLPLQLAVELGLPLAAAVLGLLGWGLWRALSRAGEPRDAVALARRGAAMAVLLVLVHSLLEYPLWYAHFLLPAAWLWGFALGSGPQAVAADPSAGAAGARALRAGAVLLGLGTAWALSDYARVAAVFRAAPGAAPLEQRIAQAQRGLFFSHHADYAAATRREGLPSDTAGDAVFRRAAHHLLDTRLMTAWAEHLHARGDTAGALHLVQRLREFRRPHTARWLEPCDADADADADADTGTRPWRCDPAPAPRHWRDFVAP